MDTKTIAPYLRHIIYAILSLLTLQVSGDNTPELETVLSLAGKNRSELEAVLKNYAQIHPDKEKLQAAQFLIINMRWHESLVPVRKHHTNAFLDSLTYMADSLYYHYIKDIPQDSINTPKTEAGIVKFRRGFWQQYSGLVTKDVMIRPMKAQYDFNALTAQELIKHIDNAFALREHSATIKQLSFDDFCEYILSYRAIPDYPLIELPDTYKQLMGKYMEDIPQDSVIQRIKRYNSTLFQLKKFFPSYPYKNKIGYQELFFRNFHDCIATAHFGTSMFKVLGIPSAVEYNVAYKQFQGTHYMCSILTPQGEWTDFNAESSIPTPELNEDFKRNGSLNVFRLMFSAQKDAPFFLHGDGEPIPEELSCPFIKDVSSRLLSTTSLTLPFWEESKNKLVYLATFSSRWEEGLVPVTWAVIDAKEHSATFGNVVTERLYFPVYYSPSGELTGFHTPFYVNRSGEIIELTSKHKLPQKKQYLVRKFPWKPNMQTRSQKLIGTVVLASNNPSFTPRDTIGCISDILQPYFQDIALDTSKGPYTYYRIKTPDSAPHADIAEIQFLTDQSWGYTNVMQPAPLPVLCPEGTVHSSSDYVRLLDDSLKNIKWKAEYDGNPKTAPSTYSTINFTLKEPQYVVKIRLMPLHADNGIIPNNVYKLLHWKNGIWESLGEQTAQYNYLPYNLSEGELYWVQNLSNGKEELPFIVDKKGRQRFVYYDIMND